MTISKELLQAVRKDFDAALAIIAEKHGLKSLRAGACTHSPDGHFTFKVEGTAAGGFDKDAARYNNSAALLGLPPLGSEFKYGDRNYKVSGLNTVGTKVIADREDGKRFQFPTYAVKRLVEPKGPA